mmetsp:Transcript_7488/g.23547  ORF Transcript_7488/g.23547 Transcript_7488/m.23547 type:complete len:272 (+) Transcript_7488:1426-2241(+)
MPSLRLVVVSLLCAAPAAALKLVFAGATGGIGSAVAERCAREGHDVTILCRNAYLAVTPSRVSEDFGWVGEARAARWAEEGFGQRITFRDWTGGDELDSVSDRWVGWEDSLVGADAVVFAVGDLGRDGRQRPVEALARAAREADEAAPSYYVHLAPVDELVGATSFGERKIETLAGVEATWTRLFGDGAACLRAGRVLGLPREADSRLFPAPKDIRRLRRSVWCHLDDLVACVLAGCAGELSPGGATFVEPKLVPTLDAAAERPARAGYYL